MPARIGLQQLAPDCLSCLGLGFAVFLLRALLPCRRGSGFTFWADFFAVGAALLLAQGYAARQASAGELRWYHLAALTAGAAAAQQLFAAPLARVRRALARLLLWPLKTCATACKRLTRAARGFLPQTTAHKSRPAGRKNLKKQLQTEQRVLYNSNVS